MMVCDFWGVLFTDISGSCSKRVEVSEGEP